MNRRFRLLAALGIAMVLSVFMIYTALAGTSVQLPVVEAEELQANMELVSSERVEYVGVARGPVSGDPDTGIEFFVSDRAGDNRILVEYTGSVPDGFKPGRHVVVQGTLSDETREGVRVFEAQPGSLVTKCPSKFQDERAAADGAA